MVLYGDLETRSAVPINAGTYRYAESAELLLFAYALDDGDVQCWDALHAPMPSDLQHALNDGSCQLVFHQAVFDRTVLRHTVRELPRERFYCTMAQAHAHGLPGKLELLGRVLNLAEGHRKQADGRKLIRLFCEKQASPTKWPDEWARFIEYAKHDVLAMRAIHQRLPKSNYAGDELALYHLDQRINDRGFCVDLDLVEAARVAGEAAKARINDRVTALTDGRVERATQRDRILSELPELDALTKDDVKKALAGPLDPVARELLELRQLGNRASVSKYTRLQQAVSSDGRLRGALVFDGAPRTGRWSSHVFQAHNLPRPALGAEHILLGVDALKAGTADLLFADPVGLCADTLRSVIIAPPGRQLAVSDWSNIEGRVLAWLAGEQWKLDAFRALDAGTGPDLYVLGYSRATGTPIDAVTPKQRQMGKGMELASGYGGGVGAFINIGTSYGLDLDELAQEVPRLLPNARLGRARQQWQRAVKRDQTLGLTQAQYVACEALKALWRDTNPATVNLWQQLENAAISAVARPGTRYQAGRCTFICHGDTLLVRLPSGRQLVYPAIRLTDSGLSFRKTPNWYRASLWGGFLAENCTQAIARDILAAALPAAEAAGFEVVLHVHDEIVAEVDANSGLDDQQLSAIMVRPLPWAKDLPLAAEGYTATRYRKGA